MKFRSLNADYKKRDSLIAEQKVLIDERNKSIKALQERIKSLEKKLEIETSSKEKLIKDLKTQLDAQSNQLANLTFQLTHKQKSINAVSSSVNSFNNPTSSSALNENSVSMPKSNNNTNTNSSIQNYESSGYQLNSGRRPSSSKQAKHKSLKHSDLTLREASNADLNVNSINSSDLEPMVKTSKYKSNTDRKLMINDLQQVCFIYCYYLFLLYYIYK